MPRCPSLSRPLAFWREAQGTELQYQPVAQIPRWASDENLVSSTSHRLQQVAGVSVCCSYSLLLALQFYGVGIQDVAFLRRDKTHHARELLAEFMCKIN